MGNKISRYEFSPSWNERKLSNKTYYSLEEIKKDIIDYYERMNKFVLPNIDEINYRKGNDNYHYYDVEYLNDYHETMTEEYRIVEIPSIFYFNNNY